MGYSPSPIRRDSVISQAAQEICRYIEGKRLAPGEALPPETRLSQMLGISRNSLREALRVLHGLGHVEKTAGRRVVVAAAAQGGKSVFDQSVLVEAAPVANEVRSHIAQKCAEFSAARITNAELGELDTHLTALEAAITRQDMNAAKAAHELVPESPAHKRQKPAARGDVQPGAGGKAVQRVAAAQGLLRPTSPRASSGAAARVAPA